MSFNFKTKYRKFKVEFLNNKKLYSFIFAFFVFTGFMLWRNAALTIGILLGVFVVQYIRIYFQKPVD